MAITILAQTECSPLVKNSSPSITMKQATILSFAALALGAAIDQATIGKASLLIEFIESNRVVDRRQSSNPECHPLPSQM
jgi:hypothetical protein